MCGVAFDAVTEASLVRHVISCCLEGRGGHVVTPNVDIVRQMQDPEVHAIGNDASVVVADGQPVVLASRLQGTPLPERVTGSSLIRSVSTAALTAGLRVFLVGGSDESTGQRAAERMRESVPQMADGAIASHWPPFGFERDAEQLSQLTEALRRHRPHVVFVGLGFPKQDELALQLRTEFPQTWFIGCGAGVAMLAGEMNRAPVLVQRLGAEWLYRLAMEPRRLFRRYVVQDVPFALRMLRTSMMRRMTRL